VYECIGTSNAILCQQLPPGVRTSVLTAGCQRLHPGERKLAFDGAGCRRLIPGKLQLTYLGPSNAKQAFSIDAWQFFFATLVMNTNSESFSRAVVLKLGVNYHLGVICNSSRGNAEPKPQCCSVLFFLWRKILRVIRHNR